MTSAHTRGSDGGRGDTVAVRDDSARDFEPGNVGRPGRRRIETLALHHVRAVHARRLDRHEHLARRRPRHFALDRHEHAGTSRVRRSRSRSCVKGWLVRPLGCLRH